MSLRHIQPSDYAQLRFDDAESERRLGRWLSALGITDAPVRRAGVRESLRFFSTHMRRLPVMDALGFLAAMDLSRPVTATVLKEGTRVIAFRFPTEQEFKLFYTVPGGSPYNSGILPDGRTIVRFRVAWGKAAALHSYTTGALDHWSEWNAPLSADSLWRKQTGISVRFGEIGRLVIGGAQQLLIPGAARWLAIDDGTQANAARP
jgi:hypothetical protein